MSVFDIAVPEKLKATQLWFGSIISSPLQEDQSIQPLSPSGQPIEKEAESWIKPNPNLRPHQRIQLYNQQYWWRLLKTLRKNFPIACRLLGPQVFDRDVGIPYLCAYRPQHWSLEMLGAELPQWVHTQYQNKGKALFFDAVSVDWAMNHAFIAGETAPLDIQRLTPAEQAHLTERSLGLQKHIHILALKRHLLLWRQELLVGDEDAWLEKEFPPFPNEKGGDFIIYRNANSQVCWKPLTAAEAFLLREFASKSSLEVACTRLLKESPELEPEVEKNLMLWCHSWIKKGWLVSEC